MTAKTKTTAGPRLKISAAQPDPAPTNAASFGQPASKATTTVAAHPPAAGKQQPTKAANVVKLLSRPRGATGEELTLATGWQPHSVRAFLSGLRKTGMTLTRTPRRSGELAYGIVGHAAAGSGSPPTNADAKPAHNTIDQRAEAPLDVAAV